MPISTAKIQNALKCSTSMSEATSNVNTVSERVAIVTFIVLKILSFIQEQLL